MSKLQSDVPITAGFLSKYKNILSFLGKAFLQSLDKLLESGVGVEDVKEVKSKEKDPATGEFRKGATFSVYDTYYNIIKVAVFPQKEEGKNIVVFTMNGQTEKHKDVDSEDVFKLLDEFVEDMSGGEVVRSSKNIEIKCSFTRLCHDRYDDVALTAIKCNSADPNTALMVIDNVLNDDEFLNSVADSTSVSIVDNGYNLEVSDCDEDLTDNNNFFEYILYYMYALENVARAVHWNAKGRQFQRLHTIAEDLYNNAQEYVDVLSEWSVQYFGYVHDCAYFYKGVAELPAESGYDLDSGISALIEFQNNAVSALRLQYCNMNESCQSVVDDWIDELTKSSEYFLKRTLLQ